MGQRMIRRALVALACVALVARAQADESERLIKLANVWSTVKYLDPAFVTSGIDWDAALVHAIPAVRAAKTDDEFTAAVDGMLQELHDPATKVIASAAATPPSSPAPEGQLLTTTNDVLVVNAGAYVARYDFMRLWTNQELRPAVAKAKAIVFDLRSPSGSNEGSAADILDDLEGLTKTPLVAPAARYVFHSGYAPQTGTTSGGYYSGFLTVPGGTLIAARGGNVPARIAYVVDAGSPLPSSALALRDSGVAAIVSSTPVGDEIASGTKRIPLDDHHVARIRTSQLLGGSVQSDIVAADPLAAAIAFAGGATPPPARPAKTSAPLPESFVFPRERDYPEMQYPDVNYRLLAAFRFWSVIDRFYPYKALIGDWDAVLKEFIPRFIAAKDADEYAKAVLEMSAHVEDGHTRAFGHKSAAAVIGEWTVPFAVRIVEGQYVVTERFDDKAPVKVGDAILSVDGEPMDARIQRVWKYLTASTDTARRTRAASAALRGPKESTAELEVRGADGFRKVSVPRVGRIAPPAETALPYKMLDGNIGYADLTKLNTSQVDAMFDTFMKTKGIIFDMRGYPRGTAWAIAPRINTRNAKVGALFRRKQFSGAATFEESEAGFFFEQPLPKTDKPKYTGKTVMLIDERAISQSEHSGLFYEAANGTTFIGTPSAGANGDVTNFPLPGGFFVNFTGHDVRHADGRQLQRVGLKPDVVAAPTIAGLRAGRDEVLERAVRYVNEVAH